MTMTAYGTSEPIHDYFELTYSTHLVLDPEVTGRLAPAWHLDMATMLYQLDLAFPQYQGSASSVALRAEEATYGDLTELQLRRIGASRGDDGSEYFYDWYGNECDEHERVYLPCETVEQARSVGRIAVSRTLLQSMPLDWQQKFVRLLEQMGSADRGYAVWFFDAAGHRTDDPVPDYHRGRTHIAPNLEAIA